MALSENRIGNRLNRGKSAAACHSACKISILWFDKQGAAISQNPDVLLCGGMIPHVDVHSRRDKNLSLGCEVHRGEKVVGRSAREFCQDVRGRWCDHKRIQILSCNYMLD